MFDHGRIVEHDDRAVLAGDDGSRFRRLLALALEADDEVAGRPGLSVASFRGGARIRHAGASRRSGGRIIEVPA